jgi:hypothetical protein
MLTEYAAPATAAPRAAARELSATRTRELTPIV